MIQTLAVESGVEVANANMRGEPERSSCSGRGGFLLGPCEISIVDRTGTSPVLFCPSPLHSEACKRGRVFDETKTHHIMNRE